MYALDMATIEMTCIECGKKNLFPSRKANAKFCNMDCWRNHKRKQFSAEAEAVGLTLIGDSKKRTYKIIKKDKLFDCIITADDVSKGKPNPEGLKKILKKLNINKKESLYVGDSLYDYKASKSAKIKYVHASWGYDRNIYKNKNIIKLNHFKDISKFI